MTRFPLFVAAAIAIAALGGCAVTPATSAVSVTSSITNGQTLTKAVAWTAAVADDPDDPPLKVQFFIDGKSKWVESNPPYSFNDDSNYLHPWLLGAGKHALEVVLITQSGKTASDTATITTRAADVPAALATTTWKRVVSAPDFGPGWVPDDTPLGTWILHFDADGLLRIDDPIGTGATEAFVATAAAINVDGPANWLSPPERQGGFCEPEVSSTYTWAVDADALTLTGAEDHTTCPDRGGVLSGTWVKQG